MSNPDLDNFIKLSEAQASLAESEVDVLNKYEQALLVDQKVIQAGLQNMSLFQNIKWDAQAHFSLMRLKTQKLRELQLAKNAEEVMRRKAREVSTLINGMRSWELIRNGWMAFDYLRSHAPPAYLSKAYSVVPDDAAYLPGSFIHISPTGKETPAEEYTINKDGGSLIYWARTKTYLPILGGPAWKYIADLLTVFSEGCAIEAGKLQMQTELAEKAAQAILTRDWSRLGNTPASQAAVVQETFTTSPTKFEVREPGKQ